MAKTYTKEYLQDLKEMYDLSDIVQGALPLRPISGGDFIGVCPFHAENTPSFRVNHIRFVCFGCKERGDIFDWIMRTEKVTFQQAVERLSQRLITSPPISPPKAPAEETLLHSAEEIWRVNAAAQTYLYSKPVSSKWPDVGYDDGGLAELLERDFPLSLLIEAGLLRSSGASRLLYRYTIPVKDAYGNICGFLGRRTSPHQTPKYISPKNNAAFIKKSMLYGLEHVRPGADIMLVEGAFDAISLKQKVPSYTPLAVLGSVLSTEQAKIIADLQPRSVSVCFDGDHAGAQGALRAIRTLSTTLEEESIWLFLLPPGEDPDTFTGFSNIYPIAAERILSPDKEIIMALTTNRLDGFNVPPLLDTLAQKYVEANIKEGYPHYNIIDWVIQDNKDASTGLVEARDAMITDPSEKNVKGFLREWIQLCRIARQTNGQLKKQGGER